MKPVFHSDVSHRFGACRSILKKIPGVTVLGLLVFAGASLGEPGGRQEFPTVVEDGKFVVAPGTLVCRSRQTLKQLQSALYRQDELMVDILLGGRTGACFESAEKLLFSDIRSFNSGALEAAPLAGFNRRNTYLCRYTYAQSLRHYLNADHQLAANRSGR